MTKIVEQKRGVIINALCDSRRWDRVKLRAGDIIIATPGKSGTTWMQQIVGQLLFNGRGSIHLMRSPCPDHTLEQEEDVLQLLESQRHRRFIKTHMTLAALPFDPSVSYIFVGRDIRDMIWSAHNHFSNFSDAALQAYNDRPDRLGPAIMRPSDIRSFYHRFLETGSLPVFADGTGPWSIWDAYRDWWQARTLPNVMLVHFEQLKADLPREMRRIASFLNIPIEEANFPTIVRHCGIDYMRERASQLEIIKKLFVGGGADFIHKGTSGRWRDLLSAEESAMCETQAIEKLGAECARWLSTGQR